MNDNQQQFVLFYSSGMSGDSSSFVETTNQFVNARIAGSVNTSLIVSPVRMYSGGGGLQGRC